MGGHLELWCPFHGRQGAAGKDKRTIKGFAIGTFREKCAFGGTDRKGGAEIVSKRGDVGCRKCAQAEPRHGNPECELTVGALRTWVPV